MPGFNGTGPLGAGSMTGRGLGYCMSYIVPDTGYNPWFCRGGRGRKRRHCYNATELPRGARWASGAVPAGAVYAPPLSGGQELNFLKEQAGYLENALEQAKKRIEEMESKE